MKPEPFDTKGPSNLTSHQDKYCSPSSVCDLEFFHHRQQLSPREFLARFQTQAAELIKNAYLADDRCLRITSEEHMRNSLAEDIIYIVGVEIGIIEEFLKHVEDVQSPISLETMELEAEEEGAELGDSAMKISQKYSTTLEVEEKEDGEEPSDSKVEELRTESVYSILHALYCKQLHYRSHLVAFAISVSENSDEDGFEWCCAIANEFFRLMEYIEERATEWNEQYPYLRLVESSTEHFQIAHPTTETSMAPPHKEMAGLLDLYLSDAVYTSETLHRCVFYSISSSAIARDLFGVVWEETQMNNEVACSLAATLEDYLKDAEKMLCSEVLLRKVVEALVKATVVFYVSRLVDQAKRVRRRNAALFDPSAPAAARRDKCEEGSCLPFLYPPRAIRQIRDDVYILKSFFKTWVLQMPSLDRVIEEEFTMIGTICDFMVALEKDTEETQSNIILQLNEQVMVGVDVIRHFLRGLCRLVITDKNRRAALKKSVEVTLGALPSEMHKDRAWFPTNRIIVSGLRLETMLVQTYAGEEYGTLAQNQPDILTKTSFGKKVNVQDMKAGLKRDLQSVRAKIDNSKQQIQGLSGAKVKNNVEEVRADLRAKIDSSKQQLQGISGEKIKMNVEEMKDGLKKDLQSVRVKIGNSKSQLQGLSKAKVKDKMHQHFGKRVN